MKHRWLAVLALPFAFGSTALADEPPADGTPPGEESKPAEDEIPWLHDYEAGKAKAAEEKKGLFVYLTPTWFT